jgi:hypothetical protein
MDLSVIVTLHLAAGSLSQTGVGLGYQSYMGVVWNPEVVADVRTPALDGPYSRLGALCAYLRGSGFTFKVFQDTIGIFPEAHPGDLELQCPHGWGPLDIHPPVADWN